MLALVASGVLIVVGGLLVFGATRPKTFRIERSVIVQAPPAKIFALIRDFHHWTRWSPFEKLDPAMRKKFSGEEAGVGAVYAWEGNAKAGQGHMEIKSEMIPEQIRIQLEFTKPMKAVNTTEFILVPEGRYTEVTWMMYGASSYPARVMSVFFNMDALLGKDFETGLMNLKREAEKSV